MSDQDTNKRKFDALSSSDANGSKVELAKEFISTALAPPVDDINDETNKMSSNSVVLTDENTDNISAKEFSSEDKSSETLTISNQNHQFNESLDNASNEFGTSSQLSLTIPHSVSTVDKEFDPHMNVHVIQQDVVMDVVETGITNENPSKPSMSKHEGRKIAPKIIRYGTNADRLVMSEMRFHIVDETAETNQKSAIKPENIKKFDKKAQNLALNAVTNATKKSILQHFETQGFWKKSSATGLSWCLVKHDALLWFCNYLSTVVIDDNSELITLVLNALNRCLVFYGDGFERLMSEQLDWKTMVNFLVRLLKHEDITVKYFAAWTLHTISVAKSVDYRDFAVRKRAIPRVAQLCMSIIQLPQEEQDKFEDCAKPIKLLEILVDSTFITKCDIIAVLDATVVILSSNVKEAVTYTHACNCVSVMQTNSNDATVFNLAKTFGLIGCFVAILNIPLDKETRGSDMLKMQITNVLAMFAASSKSIGVDCCQSFLTMTIEHALVIVLYITTIYHTTQKMAIHEHMVNLFYEISDCFMNAEAVMDQRDKFWTHSKGFCCWLTGTLANNIERNINSDFIRLAFKTICHVAMCVANETELQQLIKTTFFNVMSEIMISVYFAKSNQQGTQINLILNSFLNAFRIVNHAARRDDAVSLSNCITTETWEKIEGLQGDHTHDKYVVHLIAIRDEVKTKFNLL